LTGFPKNQNNKTMRKRSKKTIWSDLTKNKNSPSPPTTCGDWLSFDFFYSKHFWPIGETAFSCSWTFSCLLTFWLWEFFGLMYFFLTFVWFGLFVVYCWLLFLSFFHTNLYFVCVVRHESLFRLCCFLSKTTNLYFVCGGALEGRKLTKDAKSNETFQRKWEPKTKTTNLKI